MIENQSDISQMRSGWLPHISQIYSGSLKVGAAAATTLQLLPGAAPFFVIQHICLAPHTHCALQSHS